MKYALFALLVLSVSLAGGMDTTWAKALRRCPLGGYCPTGTCNKWAPAHRVQWACNVNNCSAANCPR
jgi:hypothetical protein